eukprot:15346427-Ditylum_brightwellii.AAC.1
MLVNTDFITTANGVHVAMHDGKSFGQYTFEGNVISGTPSVSSMNFDEIRDVLRNPCVPTEIFKSFFMPNKYLRDSKCDKEDCSVPINTIEDFLDSSLPGLVLDLKSSNATYDQGLDIFNTIKAKKTTDDAVQLLMEKFQ